ncbi:hypothetical protein V6N13_049206 [Hibiscus sabdariffa]
MTSFSNTTWYPFYQGRTKYVATSNYIQNCLSRDGRGHWALITFQTQEWEIWSKPVANWAIENIRLAKQNTVQLYFSFSLKMEFPKPPSLPSNPLLSLSSFFHRLGAELATRLHHTNRLAANLTSGFSQSATSHPRPLFASVSQPKAAVAAAATLSPEQVAKTLAGTAVYTVSNSNNEFVLISDPNGAKSIGLLCFRLEDAEAFLAQMSEKNSGWDDLIFIPPGKSHSQHIQDVVKV